MSNYDKDIENFNDEQKSLKKYAIEQVVTKGTIEKNNEVRHECMLCQRYANSDDKGVIVHIVKSHANILRLIKETR